MVEDAAASASFVAMPMPYFGAEGGWSGIDVAPDGTAFWAVSDAGYRTSGRLLRQAGVLSGIDAAPPERLPGLFGRPEILEADDAEGIDAGTDGREIWLSFEGFVRLRRYAGPELSAHWVPDVPRSAQMPKNFGFEALARDRSGVAYAIPEVPIATGPGGRAFPVYRFAPETGVWSVPLLLSFDSDWLVVGADFGPDGLLYVLERRLRGIAFASRIRRFALPTDGTPAPAALTGEEVYRSALGVHGNLEGIGMWRDAKGHIRAVLIADDNHIRFQRSQIVEVTLPLASSARGE